MLIRKKRKYPFSIRRTSALLFFPAYSGLSQLSEGSGTGKFVSEKVAISPTLLLLLGVTFHAVGIILKL
jgi:hypothetical protein